MQDTILVSLDGSLEAEAVLWEVERLLSTNPAKVVLLSVEPTVDLAKAVSEMRAASPDALDVSDNVGLLTYRSDAEIRHYLEGISKRLEKTGSQTVIEVSFRNPASEILFFARHYKVDLIAMATHGRTGLDRILHGSVTENVLHRAPCPMLIVHVPDEPLPRFASSAPATVDNKQAV